VAGDQRTRLETLLDTLQQRWGEAVLQSGNRLKPRPSSSLLTGFPALDQVLHGGLLDGQTIELLGRPTSGMTTLAYKMLAQAQFQNTYGLYIDLDSTFDPDYAARCGVVLERLLLARPETDLQALTIARDLLASGSVSMIVLDLGRNQPSAESLQRLTHILNRSGGLVILLQTINTAHMPGGLVGRSSAMRLLVEWNTWLERDDDIRGYRTCVTLLKHRTATGQQVMIEIDFDDTVAGEPL
jgi:hypothetical protein